MQSHIALAKAIGDRSGLMINKLLNFQKICIHNKEDKYK